MIVNFLILGAQKGGSTWLYDNIRTHPGIFTPKQELHYFSNDLIFAKGTEWYHSHFDRSGKYSVLGEKTPEYLTVIPTSNKRTSTEAHHRIKKYNPEMKLVVVLREPIARLKSAVNHMIRTQEVSPFISLSDVVTGSLKTAGDSFSLLENGLYYENIVQYRSVFPANQIKIYFFETDIIKKPLATLQSMCEFINVPFDESYFPNWKLPKNEYKMSKPALVLNHYFPKLRFVNNRLNHIFSPHKVKAEDETIQYLKTYYKQSNLKLKELTGFIPENWYY